jgi:type IV secretory pathway VirB10-like protein
VTAPPGSRQAHREATERDKRVRRWLLRISLANWGIAALAWTTSAYLGIESPARLIVYSVLFVIGLVAAILAILTYLLEKFAHRPTPPEDADHEDGEPEGDEPKADTPAAEKPQPEKPKADEPAAEVPQTEKPQTEKPKADEPAAEKPQPEKPQPEKPKSDGDDAGSPPVVTG